MIPKYKRHSIIGLSLGLGLAGGSISLVHFDLIPSGVALVAFLVGVGIYIWGCAALATAKG